MQQFSSQTHPATSRVRPSAPVKLGHYPMKYLFTLLLLGAVGWGQDVSLKDCTVTVNDSLQCPTKADTTVTDGYTLTFTAPRTLTDEEFCAKYPDHYGCAILALRAEVAALKKEVAELKARKPIDLKIVASTLCAPDTPTHPYPDQCTEDDTHWFPADADGVCRPEIRPIKVKKGGTR